MSATDELRRILDERGVEHMDYDYPMDRQTVWNRTANGWGARYVEYPSECTLRIFNLTPEQAVAATLGELNPDGLPCGLTISDDGTLLDWRGENYVRQSIVRDVKRKPNGDVDRCETCGDDRFELIDKAKRKLLECTNIESRPEEVFVLDSILFRCWQMGWLDQLSEAATLGDDSYKQAADYWRRMYEELLAKSGGGECEMEILDTFEEQSGDEQYLCLCRECGSKRWEPAHDLPLYCRKCGRKVKR